MAQETRKIVRLMKKDLPGDVSIERALCRVRGLNFMTAHAVRLKSGFDSETKLGDLSEEQLSTLLKILEKPHSFGIPSWMMNRKKDPSTGIDSHAVEANLMLTHREDIARMKKLKSYRGIRHMFSLPVRGQRTRSSGRKERSVGVVRKAIAGAATSAKKGGK